MYIMASYLFGCINPLCLPFFFIVITLLLYTLCSDTKADWEQVKQKKSTTQMCWWTGTDDSLKKMFKMKNLFICSSLILTETSVFLCEHQFHSSDTSGYLQALDFKLHGSSYVHNYKGSLHLHLCTSYRHNVSVVSSFFFPNIREYVQILVFSYVVVRFCFKIACYRSYVVEFLQPCP